MYLYYSLVVIEDEAGARSVATNSIVVARDAATNIIVVVGCLCGGWWFQVGGSSTNSGTDWK